MLARSKLNSIESKISEALINNEISHEDFTTIINEEKNYGEIKESIRLMGTQRSDIENITQLKKIKEWTLIKLLDKMQKYKTISSYCLRCVKKNPENINPRISKIKNDGTVLSSKYAICGGKKSRFIRTRTRKEQEAQ